MMSKKCANFTENKFIISFQLVKLQNVEIQSSTGYELSDKRYVFLYITQDGYIDATISFITLSRMLRIGIFQAVMLKSA